MLTLVDVPLQKLIILCQGWFVKLEPKKKEG